LRQESANALFGMGEEEEPQWADRMVGPIQGRQIRRRKRGTCPKQLRRQCYREPAQAL
ncbi:uncharacterized protein METZ01_LOCUS191915, partial [marine metagenome]